jgi:hypothetical protein
VIHDFRGVVDILAPAPGDTILAESLTYAGLKSQAQLLGIRVQPIEFDSGGIVAEELENAFRTGSVKAVYCQPNAQNPIGTSLSNERRRAIAEAARRCELSILEDDTYSYMAADGARPIATFAPERTLYLTTLTKCLLAGLRVGYLVTPEGSEATHERALMNSGALGAMPATISVELASHWIESGVADRAATAKRDEARAPATRAQIPRRIRVPHLQRQSAPVAAAARTLARLRFRRPRAPRRHRRLEPQSLRHRTRRRAARRTHLPRHAGHARRTRERPATPRRTARQPPVADGGGRVAGRATRHTPTVDSRSWRKSVSWPQVTSWSRSHAWVGR